MDVDDVGDHPAGADLFADIDGCVAVFRLDVAIEAEGEVETRRGAGTEFEFCAVVVPVVRIAACEGTYGIVVDIKTARRTVVTLLGLYVVLKQLGAYAILAVRSCLHAHLKCRLSRIGYE